jgi:hypothetical protein
MEMANTLLTVMRGTSYNDAGDRLNVGTVLYEHLPAALIETSRGSYDQASQTRRTIRQQMCVVPDWADVNDDDTIMDETTGFFYMVESIEAQPSLGVPGDVMLTLRSRSGIAIPTD